MKKTEFKEMLFEVLSKNVGSLNFDEKIRYVEDLLIKYQKENEELRDVSEKGNPWRDEDLMIILSDAPTTHNCMKYAKIYKRGYGSIEQIYRWASSTDQRVANERPDDAFIQQIKRIAKQIGFRA